MEEVLANPECSNLQMTIPKITQDKFNQLCTIINPPIQSWLIKKLRINY